MKRREIVKSILGAGLLTVILISSFILGIVITGTSYGIAMFSLLGFITVGLLLWFCYPIWFKDYINEFWKEHESKNMQDD